MMNREINTMILKKICFDAILAVGIAAVGVGCRVSPSQKPSEETVSEVMGSTSQEELKNQLKACCEKTNLIDFGICVGDTSRFTDTCDAKWNKSAADAALNYCRHFGFTFKPHSYYAKGIASKPSANCPWQTPAKWPQPPTQ